jgi:hypothetical protein
MSLKTELQKIINLYDPFVEASKKLVNTYMYVNEELHYIKAFDAVDGSIITYDEKKELHIKIKPIKSLKVWLPETGIYPFANGNFVILSRSAKKQWLKSFSDSFYITQIKGNAQWKGIKGKKELIIEMSKRNCLIIYTAPDKYIWYIDRIIGYVKNSAEIICTEPIFQQELKDWIRYAI